MLTETGMWTALTFVFAVVVGLTAAAAGPMGIAFLVMFLLFTTVLLVFMAWAETWPPCRDHALSWIDGFFVGIGLLLIHGLLHAGA